LFGNSLVVAALDLNIYQLLHPASDHSAASLTRRPAAPAGNHGVPAIATAQNPLGPAIGGPGLGNLADKAMGGASAIAPLAEYPYRAACVIVVPGGLRLVRRGPDGFGIQ
jgi:hypothetical protein